MVSLVATGLVGFLLASYLGLVRSQNVSTMRSQGWNATIPVVEAGIEEALTHMNINPTATNLAFNGWTQIGNLYAVKRFLGSNYYIVTISNWVVGQPPTIESRGYVKAPILLASAPASAPIFAAAGANNAAPDSFIARGVRVNLARSGLYTKALIAKSKITISGSVQTDSFDSSNPLYSTNGTYIASKARDNGDVASNGTIEKVIDTSGSIEIYGKVHTGPGGTVGFSGQAAVGDKAWHQAGMTGIKPGWSRNDMNFDFAAAPAAPTGGFFISNGSVGGTNYTPLISSPGHYRTTSSGLSMSGSARMMVTCHASLFIDGDWSMSGSSRVILTPGASLTVYVKKNVSLSGQGIANQTGRAHNLVIYGGSQTTDLNFSGNTDFVGIVYAPDAKISLSGGAAYIGSMICREANLSGTFDFHYDEALANFGGKGLVITSWNEMTQDEVKRGPTL